MRIKKYHGKSDPEEKAHDFSNVEESWKYVDLVAYTSTLKIRVSCTNLKFEQAFCLFNSYIETNAETNQMLFRMRYIKDYVPIKNWKSGICTKNIFVHIPYNLVTENVPDYEIFCTWTISGLYYFCTDIVQHLFI